MKSSLNKAVSILKEEHESRLHGAEIARERAQDGISPHENMEMATHLRYEAKGILSAIMIIEKMKEYTQYDTVPTG
jgi:hypothetical protein